MNCKKNKIIITGATGMVANNLISLLSNNDYEIYAVTSRKEKAADIYKKDTSIKLLSYDELYKKDYYFETAVHTAFTRKNDPSEVARALDITNDLFCYLRRTACGRVLYISSRSVYLEPNEGELNDEKSKISPNSLIGIGKYACEKMLELTFANTETSYSSLRIASINEVKESERMIRPINIFVDNVLNGNPIKVIGGMQVMSFIDPMDVATAIKKIIEIPRGKLKKVYNVGTGWECTDTLLNIANKVRTIGVNEYQCKRVPIEVEKKLVIQRAGLNIDRLQEDTGWMPQYGMEDMIRNIYNLYIKEQI